MEMTDNEIVRSYREARDKGKQVKILSQLNLCEIGEILDILTKNGVKPQELPRTRRGKAKTETVESPPKHRIRSRSRSRSRRQQTKGAESRSTETRCWSTNSSWNVKQTRPRKHTSPKSGSSTADKMKSISSSKSWREVENAV